jgi:hypothetical protein
MVDNKELESSLKAMAEDFHLPGEDEYGAGVDADSGKCPECFATWNFFLLSLVASARRIAAAEAERVAKQSEGIEMGFTNRG